MVKSRRSWIMSLLVGAACTAALLWFARGWGQDHREAWPEESESSAQDADRVMVTVEPVAARTVQRTVEAVGTLHGFEEVTISAKVEGRVRKILHDVDDRVKSDELLLEVDPTDYQLAVQQAERGLQVELARLGFQDPPGPNVDLCKVPSVMQAQTRMENARARYDRGRRLMGSRAISAEDVENAGSEYRSTQAEYANQLLLARAGLATIQLKQTALAVAQQQLKDSKVHAPTPSLPVPGADGGVRYAITARTVADGTLVRPGTEIFKLVINDTLKLRVPVPERFSADVKRGQQVEVSTAASTQPFQGKVTRINPAVDVKTRTFEVEIQVPNPGETLKPGSFAKAAILTRLDSQAVTVPLSAVVQFAGITKVFVHDHGRAREVRVALGKQTTDWVEIASPKLPPGAMVIVSGQTALADDSLVAVRAGEKMAPEPAPGSDVRP